MSLEGRLRDLGLQELCQLLALSRKSGTLHLHAQLEGRAAAIVFHQGSIVDAWRSEHGAADEVSNGGASTRETTIALGGAIANTRTPTRASDSRQVESTVFDLLTWRDGAFAFAPDAPGSAAPSTGVRLGTEAILVESTRRSDGWAELADRIPHSGVVPAFVDIEPKQLPLLNLVPQQWEILTRVDGQRDLPALAQVLGRDVLEVAAIVHGLIGTGLLTLREAVRTTRALPTPPSIDAVAEPQAEPDLWIPGSVHQVLTAAPSVDEPDESADDIIFDPIRVGVQTPEGMPRWRTPLNTRATPDEPSHAVIVTSESGGGASNGASNNPSSIDHTIDSNIAIATRKMAADNALIARILGDDAARRGDMVEAIEQWSAYLRENEHAVDAHLVREAIALGSRLHELLYPSPRE